MSEPAAPRCMTPAEIEGWWSINRGVLRGESTSPCHDCSRVFAETMRLVGQCDGHYPGELPEPPPQRRWWAYPTEEARVAARRESWRLCVARKRQQVSA